MPAREQLAGLVEEITPRIVELRHRLHAVPEPAHREFATTALVREFLASEGMRFQDRQPRTGGWIDVGDQPSIGFRADLDALPIIEPSGNRPCSENDGWMHACGHDAHTAIAAGIAIALDRLRPDTGFRVIFQPGEEANPGGAIELVSEGVVEHLRALVAFHVDPALRAGRIGIRSGPITGSADALTVTLHGPGGHTSRPHRTVDLVDAAARVVTDLPTALRRAVDARTALVTVFGAIHGGGAANVIPTEVVIRGTVRTFDPELWDVLPGLVDKSLGGILALSGAGYTIDYQQGVPPVVNDPSVIGVAREAIADALGTDALADTEQSMGGEDFANYLSVTPGALLRLGAASGGGDLHSASFEFNDEAIAIGLRAGVSTLLALADNLA